MPSATAVEHLLSAWAVVGAGDTEGAALPSRTSKRREAGQVHGEGLGESLGRVRTDWSGQAWGRDVGASGRRMGVSPLSGAD